MMTRNVAIYARVSTEHEAQLSALENQVQYYDNIMAQHPNWILYDRYIDEGITGTSTKKRKNFMRMMEDADKGCFDLVITREVSRFARNTVDTLQETRNLKRKGIEVWFTEDNIWTMNDEDGELRLTIMATLAQNESKKTSLRVKAGQMVSFQNAIPYGNGNILGYDRVGKEYVINPEQAETVRMIYDLYLSGLGERAITYELEKIGRKTSTGKTTWFCSYIGRILNNAFYSGTIVYRKEYVPDYLEQKKIRNKGEIENIVVEGKHQPIVTKEEFARVQEIMNERRMTIKNNQKSSTCGHNVSKDVWVRKLVCECGCTFNRKKWHSSNGKPQFAYQCYNQLRKGSFRTREKKGLSTEGVCRTEMIPRWKLDTILKMALKLFLEDRTRIIAIAQDLLERNIKEEMAQDDASQIQVYQSKIRADKRKFDTLLDLRLAGEISKEQFSEKKEELEKNIESYKSQIETLSKNKKLSAEELEARLEVLKYSLESNFDYDVYDVPDSLVDTLVDKVVVYTDRYEFYFKFFINEPISCLVEGSRKSPKPSFIEKAGEKSFVCNTPDRQLSQKQRRNN